MSTVVPKSFKSAFEGKRTVLTKKLKVRDGLLALLEDKRLITDEQRMVIEADNLTPARQASKLIDELLRADDSKVGVFLKCLVENSQKHVVSIILGNPVDEWEYQSAASVEPETPRDLIPGTSSEMARPTSTKEQVHSILDKATPDLCRELDIDHGMLPLLLSKGVMKSEQIETCKAGKTPTKRVEIMLDILKRCPLSSYAKFRQILSSDAIGRDDLVRNHLPEISAEDERTVPATRSHQEVATTTQKKRGNDNMERSPIEKKRAKTTNSGIVSGLPVRKETESGAIRTIAFTDLQHPKAVAQGGFGVIYRARHGQWGIVAYKELQGIAVVDEDDRLGKDLKREAQMLKLDHPNIVKLLGLVFEPGHYGLVFEFAKFAGLDKVVVKYEVEFSLKVSFGKELIEGMTYLHSFDTPVIHGDLKLQNILIDRVDDEHVAKICDFGLTKWKTYTTQQTKSSGDTKRTVTHVPPEIWIRKLTPRTKTFDVYSFGILLWELFSESVPFKEVNGDTELIKDAVKDGERPSLDEVKCPEVMSEFVKGVIERCWHQQPKSRPMFHDLKEEFEQFISEHELSIDKSKPLELRKSDNS